MARQRARFDTETHILGTAAGDEDGQTEGGSPGRTDKPDALAFRAERLAETAFLSSGPT